MTTTIQKWGNSFGIRIPKKIVQNNGLSEGSGVSIREIDGSIIIEPKQSLLNLKKIMKKYKPETYHNELDWGKSVGREM